MCSEIERRKFGAQGFLASNRVVEKRWDLSAERQRLLIDQDALVVLAGLRAHPEIDPADHPIDEGDQEDEWLLRAIDQRFAIRPIYRDRDGLIVAELASRGG
jgi:hypothetical protein